MKKLIQIVLISIIGVTFASVSRSASLPAPPAQAQSEQQKIASHLAILVQALKLSADQEQAILKIWTDRYQAVTEARLAPHSATSVAVDDKIEEIRDAAKDKLFAVLTTQQIAQYNDSAYMAAYKK